MKKLIGIIIAVCIIFSFQGASLADDSRQVYSLSDSHMKITLPNDFIVITRDTKTLPKQLEGSGTTIESFQSSLESQNIYLDAISPDYGYEIAVGVVKQDDMPFYDLQSCSKSELDGAEQGMMDELNKNPVQTFQDTALENHYTNNTLCQYPAATYFKFKDKITLQKSGKTKDASVYFTIKNGTLFKMSASPVKATALSDAQEAEYDSIIQTAQFDNLPAPTVNTNPVNAAKSLNYYIGYTVGYLLAPILLVVCIAVIVIIVVKVKKSRVKNKHDNTNT